MRPFDPPPPSDVARAWHLCRELAALLDRIPGERLGPLQDLPPLLEKVVASGRRPRPGHHPNVGGTTGATPEATPGGGEAVRHGAPGAPGAPGAKQWGRR